MRLETFFFFNFLNLNEKRQFTYLTRLFLALLRIKHDSPTFDSSVVVACEEKKIRISNFITKFFPLVEYSTIIANFSLQFSLSINYLLLDNFFLLIFSFLRDNVTKLTYFKISFLSLKTLILTDLIIVFFFSIRFARMDHVRP